MKVYQNFRCRKGKSEQIWTLWYESETDPISLHFFATPAHPIPLLSGFLCRIYGTVPWILMHMKYLRIWNTDWHRVDWQIKMSCNAGLRAAWFCGPAVLCGGGHPPTWRAGLSRVHHLIRALREGTLPYSTQPSVLLLMPPVSLRC